MRKIFLSFLILFIYSCAVSIGNKSVSSNNGEISKISKNTVYSENGKTMVAINYILPLKAGLFEMLTKTVILPAFKRQDLEVYESIKFLVPEEPNINGNFTYMFIADPYMEEKNYDILKVLVQEFGRSRAEEYFERWIGCFANEQEVISFR